MVDEKKQRECDWREIDKRVWPTRVFTCDHDFSLTHASSDHIEVLGYTKAVYRIYSLP